MTAGGGHRRFLPRLRRSPGLAGWAPYAVAVTLLSAALGAYGVDPGSTPSLVLVVWFLLLAGSVETSAGVPRAPRAEGSALVSWAPSLVAGVAGFGIFLETLQPLPFSLRDLLLALLSAAVAWALAPGSPLRSGGGAGA